MSENAPATRPSYPNIPLRQVGSVEQTRETPDAESTFRHLLDWVGQGVAAMEEIADDAIREQVFALLEGVDLIHRQSLEQILVLLKARGDAEVLQALTHDPVIHALLDMYDLNPVDEYQQAERALQPVYSYIESHGGHLDLLGVHEGEVRVRLSGSCGSCPGSAGTLERVVEEALREGYPAFSTLLAEAPPTPKPTPIRLEPTVRRRPRWVNIGTEDAFPAGELRALWPEGHPVLVVRIGPEVYAHENGCPPGSALGLHLGSLDGTTLTCPWHRCQYDVRTGKRLDAEGKLNVLPVAVQDGMVKLALGLEEVVTA